MIRAKIVEILKKIKPEMEVANDGCFEISMQFDSFDVIFLYQQLCKEFKIFISGEKINPENFSSLNNLVKLVEECRACK